MSEKIKIIAPYLDAAFKIENGKHNAADSETENNDFKTATLPQGIVLNMKSI